MFKSIKKIKKILFFILLSLIAIPLVLYTLLRFSFVQNIIVHQVTEYLSGKLKTEVSVGAVDISYFLDISLKNVVIKDKHNHPLIDASNIELNLDDIYFRNKLINVDDLKIDKTFFHIVKYKNEKEHNFQFIVDAFSSGDTLNADTSDVWRIRMGSVDFSDIHFVYHDENAVVSSTGMDFNYIDIKNLNLNVSNLNLLGDSIFAAVNNLSFKDKSGFELMHFSTLFFMNSKEINAYRTMIKTTASDIQASLKMEMKSFSDFDDFTNKIKLNANISPSRINLSDIAYFIPDIWGMNNEINVSGEVKGRVSKLRGNKINLYFGKESFFKGDFSVSGLPDLKESFIKLKVKDLRFNHKDMAAIRLPVGNRAEYVQIPEELVRLGNIRFNGQFTGFVNNFVANGNLVSSLGDITTDIVLSKNNENGLIEYNGHIASKSFDIGKMLGLEERLGEVSMNTEIQGQGIDAKDVSVSLKGNIYSIKFNHYQYNNITISGILNNNKFTGNADINDENIELALNGVVDMSGSLPVFNLHADINRMRLSQLNIIRLENDSLVNISASIYLNYSGNSIDNIQGDIVAKNTEFTYNHKKYHLDDIKFSNISLPSGDKTLTLKSDYLDSEFKGNFSFKDIYPSFLKFMNDYLPSYSPDNTRKTDSIPEENFTFRIKIKDAQPLCDIFVPELKISKNTIIFGSYSTIKSNLEVNLVSARMKYAENTFEDFFLSGRTADSKININMGCEHLMFSDSMGLDNVYLKTISYSDSILFALNWKNNNDLIRNSAEIAGFTTFHNRPRIEAKLLQARLIVNDTLWKIDPANYIIIDSNSVHVRDFVIGTNTQQLKINGVVSDNPADVVTASFKNFDLSDFDYIIQKNNDIDLSGFINGDVSISNVYKSPVVISDIVIDNFHINDDKIGKAVFYTKWDDSKKALQLSSDIIYEGSVGSNVPLSVSGFYYPERTEDNFDIDINLKNFKLRLLERYISAVSSNFKGYATGKLRLTGTPDYPDLHGMLYMIVKGFRVDYLNTNYSFTDSVKVTKKSFEFDNMVIYDSKGDTAIFDGRIIHDNFYDFSLDLSIKSYNFECLNTNATLNNLYYGKAVASGIFKIHGNVNNVTIDISAKSEKGTSFNIPISDELEISESGFVTFESKYKDLGKKVETNIADAGITLNFDLEITNDADIQLIFDSRIGDIIRAKGKGNLIMKINTLGDFNMYGDYIINEGNYLFTLQNVINKKFDIIKGSTITFDGSPYDAGADIQAVYGVKTALYDLFLDSSEVYKKRVNVECVLSLKDKLMNPALDFDIKLPNSDENTNSLLKSIVNSEQEMNRQIFSLLVLNRFMPPEKYQYTALGSGFGSTSTELLSEQLSNWLSQISKSFDIGVKYRPGTEITSEELEVALSTQLFNDRLTIDGNVGVSGSQANKSSNIVGDVNIDYKITSDGRLHVKGFNRSNNVDLLNTNSPYTQGLGLFYKREFDVLSELFRRTTK